MDYLYDTSSFPSPLIIPLIAKVFLNQPFNQRTRCIIKRTNILVQSFSQRKESFISTGLGRRKGIWEFPLPANSMRVPVWHTLGYVLGWKFQKQILRSCLRREWFYYLCHPADLLDPKEICAYGGSHRLTRSGVSLEEKEARFEEMVSLIVQSSSKVVTFDKMVAEVTHDG